MPEKSRLVFQVVLSNYWTVYCWKLSVQHYSSLYRGCPDYSGKRVARWEFGELGTPDWAIIRGVWPLILCQWLHLPLQQCTTTRCWLVLLLLLSTNRRFFASGMFPRQIFGRWYVLMPQGLYDAYTTQPGTRVS